MTIGIFESLEGRLFMATQTFSNTSSITISDSFSPPTTATPYGSSISVPALSGTVSQVSVKLTRFGHSRPADADILLVGPTGESVILLSDAGSNLSVSNISMTFADGNSKAPDLSQLSNNANYRPTDYEVGDDDFPSPAPFDAPSATALSVFNGQNPAGTWSLYVVDDSAFNSGQIAGGWSITITTTDTNLPASPSTPDLASDSDTGDSNSDNITRVTTPTFTGTAPAGTAVTILSDGAPVGSAAASGGSYSVSTSALSDATHNITATATNASGTSAPSGGLAITIDTAAPTVSNPNFSFDTSHVLSYSFSESVKQSLGAEDLDLQNLTTPGGFSVNAPAYDDGSNSASFGFTTSNNGILPDGNYRATLLSANVTDVAGNPLNADDVFEFFVLSADADHDHFVNTNDFGALATHFNETSGTTFGAGDFNYDGQVNALDFGILVAKFGTHLSDPALRPLSGPASLFASIPIRHPSPRDPLLESTDSEAVAF